MFEEEEKPDEFDEFKEFKQLYWTDEDDDIVKAGWLRREEKRKLQEELYAKN